MASRYRVHDLYAFVRTAVCANSVVPSSQGSRQQRESRSVGEGRRRRAWRPWVGMVVVLGPNRGTPSATPTVAGQPQAGDLGEEVGGSTAVGWGKGLQDEVQDAEKPEAGWHSCWELQEACLAVLPDEDGALSHRAVSPLDENPTHSPVLVVPIPEPDSGAPLQRLSEVEGPTEDPTNIRLL